MTTFTERRERFRAILTGSECVHPAAVFDPLVARAAHRLGFEVMMLPGSYVSYVMTGAPDIVVATLTEVADLVRRLTRVSPLPLLVDADHGFGNALNVMRCVVELEQAGVAALSIEDTALPRPFGQAEGESLISLAEATGKLRAAVAARTDPATVILGRTSAIRIEGLDAGLGRVRAFSETGVDGIFLVGARTRAEVEAGRSVTSLPFVLGGLAPELQDRHWLAAMGVTVSLHGRAPYFAALKAAYDTLAAVRAGVPESDLRATLAPPDLLADLTAEADYDTWTRHFLT
jgi:oxaloacetate decarboxylase